MIFIPMVFISASAEDTAADGHNTDGKIAGRWLFLPEAAFLLDGAGYFSNDYNYTAVTHRVLTLDILRYKNFVMATYINEELRYREAGKARFDPWIPHYDLDFFSLRKEFKYGSLSYFIDHQCSNKINQADIGPMELRWYGTGIRWESNGIRPGHKNDGIDLEASVPFSYLDNLNYMISVVHRLSNGYKKQFRHDMFVKGLLRYDIVRVYNLIPYAEGSFRAIIDEDYTRVRFDRTIEGGVRIIYNNICVTPYFARTRMNDVETYNDPGLKSWLAGFRVESVLHDYFREDDSGSDIRQALPELHFLAGYAKYIVSDYMNVNHKFNVDIDIIRINNFSLFINNGFRHDSTGQGGLFPRYMEAYAEGGISWLFDGPGILIEPCYRGSRFDDGNQYRGYRQRFHLAGVRVKNLKMKTGYVNDGIEFKDSGFEWLNKFGWQLSVNKIIRGRNWPYDWDLGAGGQWDILRKYLFVPYVALQARYLRGERHLWEYVGEAGVRLYDDPQVIIYYEHMYRTGSDPDNGYTRNQSMLGLRIEL